MDSLLIAFIYLGILLAKSLAATRYVLNYGDRSLPQQSDKVTLLQPILSGDPMLAQVLEDNVKHLPQATFFWLIDENDSEAQGITRKICADHPHVNILVKCMVQPAEGINPKLFKLEAAWREVKTEYCLVLDDDTRLPQHTLDTMIVALDNTEISTALPFYRSQKNVFSKLLAQFVNNNSVLTYLSLSFFKSPLSINGMCYALKLDTLKRLHGFSSLLNHLTDDLAVATYIKQQGGRIAQVPAFIEVETSVDCASTYIQQMHRWFLFAILLLRRQGGAVKLMITLLHGLPPLLFWLLMVLALLSPSITAISSLLLVVAVRSLILMAIQKRLSQRLRHHLVLSVVSELLQPLHLLHAALNRKIRWRSRKYHVYDNDHFVCQ